MLKLLISAAWFTTRFLKVSFFFAKNKFLELENEEKSQNYNVNDDVETTKASKRKGNTFMPLKVIYWVL